MTFKNRVKVKAAIRRRLRQERPRWVEEKHQRSRGKRGFEKEGLVNIARCC